MRVFLRRTKKIIPISVMLNSRNISFQVASLMIFKEIEANYHFFRKLTSLNVTVKFSAKSYLEALFLLRSEKIYIKILQK